MSDSLAPRDETEVPSKRTPGPWGWVIHDHSMASLGVLPDPGLGDPLVLSVSPCAACADRANPKEWQWGRCCTPNEANARLIAAAPDLLDLLTLALPYVECAEADPGYKPQRLALLVKEIREAIAKATQPTTTRGDSTP